MRFRTGKERKGEQIMQLLVTGANGFLGQHIKAELKKHNIQALTPTSQELDLTNYSSVHDYFYRNRPDTILDAAAIVGGIKKNITYPFDIIQSNLKMSTNLFDAIHKYNIHYVYNLGTICSYPKYCTVPFHENDLFAGKPEESNFAYSTSKRALYVLHDSYRKQIGLKGAFFLIANLYGPHDHFDDSENSHVIPGLISKFIYAKDNGKDVVECWGTGVATRSFVFAEDVAEVLVKSIVSKFDCSQPINIGTDYDISIYSLAHMISYLVGFNGKICFTGDVSDGQPTRKLNVQRAKHLLNWEAKTDLVTGLTKTIEWYKNHRDTIPIKGS